MNELFLQNQELHNIQEEVKKLKEENLHLNQIIIELREHLKKYTAPKRSKKYYQEHKEEIKTYNQEYHKNYKRDAIKKAEYNKEYYKKKKEKINKENPESENIKENN
jgi:hypothetical protein